MSRTDALLIGQDLLPYGILLPLRRLDLLTEQQGLCCLGGAGVMPLSRVPAILMSFDDFCGLSVGKRGPRVSRRL